ncbi:MAG: CpaF family protein [archaeon]
MAEEDYLADLIKKVKEAKKQEKETAKNEPQAEEKAKGKLIEPAGQQEAIVQPRPSREPKEEPKKPLRQPNQPGEEKAPELPPEPEETEGDEEKKKSTVEKELETASEKKLLEQYGEVRIYKVPGKPLPYYVVPVARPTKQEKAVINTIKEAATRLIEITPYKIRDIEQRRNVYRQRVLEILRNSPELHIPERRFDFYAETVVREMVGYGIIDPLVMDDNLEEIMVIGAKKPVYIFHRKYEMMSTNIEFYSDKEIIDLINRIARNVGRRVDISSPLLDARMPDGSRINATIPPASVEGATLTIRKFRKDPYTIIDLMNNGTLSSEAAAFLWLCVDGLGAKPANILISGGTGSGKTTLLNCLAAFIPDTERIVTIEDTAELALPMKHWIRLEARPPGLEGKGELTLDVLTKNSLRMRPDRIIVGEVRHDEAFTLFTALNTGHDGCLGTIHANSPQETIVRVTSPPMNVPEVMLSGLDIIIIEHKIHDRRKGTIRRVTEIAELSGVLLKHAQTQTIFLRDPAKDILERTNMPIKFIKVLQDFTGLSNKAIEENLKERRQFLEKLQKQGVRGMDEVKRLTQEFTLRGN